MPDAAYGRILGVAAHRFVRPVLLTLALAVAAFLLVPRAQADPCDVGVQTTCAADAGPCEAEAGANVVTTTAAGASADCRVGFTTCHAEAGVGQDLLDPTADHWCAF